MRHNNIRTFVIWAMLFGAGSAAQAQNGFNIPFSQFGIGTSDLPTSSPTAYRMGGVVYSRASRNTVNPFNPASYAAVEKESFVFDIGVNIQTCVLRNSTANQSDADGNVAYVNVAFPITKWWKTAAGIMPYSTVNYQSVNTAFDALTQSNVKTIYEGSGGVSQLYWGNGFNIGKRLSLGFNLDYLYGSITRAIAYNFLGNDSTYCINSRRQKNTFVNNLLIDLGLQYRQPLGEKYTMRLGATCRLPRTMSIKDQSLVYTYHKTNIAEYLFDTVFPEPGMSDTYSSTIEQPLAVGLGLAFERNNLWEVAVDGYYSPFSGIKYEENVDYNIFGHSSLRYADNWRLALGGEWKGNASATSYLARIGISAGVFHNHGRLALNIADQNYDLNETGVGMGFSLPMRKGRSVLTINMAYSSFGDRSILRRDCFSVGITIGSCESWFVKKKYE